MSRLMRSRCQDECEADVKATAKPMSRRHPGFGEVLEMFLKIVLIFFHITLHTMLERIWEGLWKEFEQLLK